MVGLSLLDMYVTLEEVAFVTNEVSHSPHTSFVTT